MSLPALPCHLNGRYTTTDQATVSVFDRGFIFGDGIYEVVPFYGGKPFRLEQHLARLERSLSAVLMRNPHTPAEWRTMVCQLVEQLGAQLGLTPEQFDQTVYLQVTRGVAVRDHVIDPTLAPTVFAYANRWTPPSDEMVQHGVRCVTADDFRWEMAHVKSISLMGAILARDLSHRVGATETIMFRHDMLSEAAASNVWIVKQGTVIGVPRSHLSLEGIRYGVLDTLCAALGIGFELRPVSREEVLTADEVLLTSASKEVLAVVQLDDQPVGAGVPGPVALRLQAAYRAWARSGADTPA